MESDAHIPRAPAAIVKGSRKSKKERFCWGNFSLHPTPYTLHPAYFSSSLSPRQGLTPPPAPLLLGEGSLVPPSLAGNRSEGEEVGGLGFPKRANNILKSLANRSSPLA
jgi:hypothetical protein